MPKEIEKMRHSVITGWGKCVPPAVLSNADLETVTATSDDWITTRTGIKERRISHVEVSDMSTVAAHRALAAAGKEPGDLDLIITGTCSPDRMIPSAGALIQHKLGATRAGALDLNAACSGFVYSLAVADQMIRAGGVSTVLVVGAEKLSYWLDFTDRSTAVLFGDGAGAVVLEPSDAETGVLAYELGTDGSAKDILCVGHTGTEGNPIERGLPELRMDGPEVFKRAVTTMGDASVRVIAQAGLEFDDIDLLIPHQANVRIIDAVARRLRLAPEKVFVNIASYGNTSAATIPIALTEALEEGRVQPGANLVLTAFGGGLTWAAAALRWGDRVTPLGTSEAELSPSQATALELLQGNVDAYGSGAS